MMHVTTLTPHHQKNQNMALFLLHTSMSQLTNPAKPLRQSTIDILKSVDNLPTLPDLFLHIQTTLDNPESTLQDLTQAIERDQVVTATIVKIANSSYYNPLGKPASSLSFAISRLGRAETSSIALSTALLYGFSMPTGIANMRHFWAHAFAVGQICRKIAACLPEQNHSSADQLFLSGLLHDIGRAILGIRVDSQYFEQSFASLHGEELIQAEQKNYGMNHAEVGAIVLQQWGFPLEIYQRIHQHHDKQNNTLDGKILSLADHIAHQHLTSIPSIEEAESKVRAPYFNDIIIKELTENGLL